jgi:hypothetical protein
MALFVTFIIVDGTGGDVVNLKGKRQKGEGNRQKAIGNRKVANSESLMSEVRNPKPELRVLKPECKIIHKITNQGYYCLLGNSH